MTIVKQRVTCHKCQNVSYVDIVYDAPVSVVAASMEAARCPHCGSDKLGLGGAHDDAPASGTIIAARASWWRNRGEVGTSSGTIWSVMTGGALPHGHASVPWDPDDFSRCRKLLELIPEWRAQLHLVAQKYPEWTGLVANWDELDAMFDEEASRGWKAPHRMYGRMKELTKASR